MGHLGAVTGEGKAEAGSWPDAPGSTGPAPWKMESESSLLDPVLWPHRAKEQVTTATHLHSTSVLRTKDPLLSQEMSLKQKGACGPR